eukprot:TRINITY_DN5427_c0_g1_i1.p2 TRINITY_DN5427_c0_g1~~TRINITY_DN5427_c0_g1_i1.p2  ORF type:complete len:107 (+),score=29.56 TRINITY_DN5427_c0_g1_i1:127-447(+)
MAVRMRPDWLIQRSIAQDNKYAAANAYASDMKKVSQSTEWFESKVKYDFKDGEKRSAAFIAQEMECANVELKSRRRARLKALYENETRVFEDELADLGLAVQRLHI